MKAGKVKLRHPAAPSEADVDALVGADAALRIEPSTPRPAA